VKTALGVGVALVLVAASPAVAGARHVTPDGHASAVLAQAGPSPSPPAESPTASPSPGAKNDRGGISSGAGLMRNRLLRR
jgi:hypothetical protein